MGPATTQTNVATHLKIMPSICKPATPILKQAYFFISNLQTKTLVAVIVCSVILELNNTRCKAFGRFFGPTHPNIDKQSIIKSGI